MDRLRDDPCVVFAGGRSVSLAFCVAFAASLASSSLLCAEVTSKFTDKIYHTAASTDSFVDFPAGTHFRVFTGPTSASQADIPHAIRGSGYSLYQVDLTGVAACASQATTRSGVAYLRLSLAQSTTLKLLKSQALEVNPTAVNDYMDS